MGPNTKILNVDERNNLEKFQTSLWNISRLTLGLLVCIAWVWRTAEAQLTLVGLCCPILA